jgi:hypothetical protein
MVEKCMFSCMRLKKKRRNQGQMDDVTLNNYLAIDAVANVYYVANISGGVRKP